MSETKEKQMHLSGPALAHVDHHVAEGVAGPCHAARADNEQPVGANVPVEPPDVGVVDADPLGQLRRPVLAVHGQQPCRLDGPVLRDCACVFGHAVQGRGHALALHPSHKVQHPLLVLALLRHQPHDQGLVHLTLHQRVPVKHGPHDGQVVPGGERVAGVPG